MRSGFSFCGIDIKDIGLLYAPELENTYVYSPSDKKIHEEEFEGHDGGYYYGAWSTPKEFVLRCVFEERQIDRGVMAEIYELFRVGRAGKLVFNRRPWCYYVARVTSPVETNFTNYLNGIITIHMKAYFPYARSDTMYNEDNDINHGEVMANTGIFDSQNIVPATSFDISGNTSIILANPGTERTPVAISILGTASSVKITNTTTNQICSFVNLDNSLGEIVCDSLSGKIIRIKNNVKYPAYLYHYDGFITLDPAYPVKREIYLDNVSDNVIHTLNTLYADYTGQYIYVDNQWHRIEETIDQHNLRLKTYVNINTSINTTISRMNEIEIETEGIPTGESIHIEFIYKPAFS